MEKKPVVVDLGYHYADEIDDYQLLVNLYESSSGQHQLLAESVNLYVIRHLNQEKEIKIGEVNYWFLKGKRSRFWLPFRLHHRINSLSPDIILLHGFSHPLQVLLLRIQTRATFIIQYHGGGYPQGARGILQRISAGLVKNYIFVAEAQAKEFRIRKLIPFKSTVYCIGEGSTHKVNIEKQKARKVLGMDAHEKICLWVGRLNANKDPITVLKGFEVMLAVHNSMRLYMIYSTIELLEEVKHLIANSDTLRHHVKLEGKIAHRDLDNYYSGADYFVLGSNAEGSGYALCEALACGCIPIVTDIPSFRIITDEARIGALWKAGDEHSFVEAMKYALELDEEEESQKAIAFFKKELSFEALAQKHFKMIRTILDEGDNRE